ncbi:hypothetical protein [uncultured Fibrobacter sp.]|uniref:hypothetical protein n=1 Tax=uncultured Fibrobacter sp. TaxID=261512 RepID=UPI0026387BD5|nr:hypothetical protein [uncultured Fibrobacter sp.]
MRKLIAVKLLLLLLLPFLCACPPDEDYEYLCWNNFECDAFVPDEDSVWMELFSGDSLLDIDSTTFSADYSHLPNFKTKYDFRERFTLRIHVFCNGEWLDDIDFEFENRRDKYTNISLNNNDLWHTGTPGVQVFTDEQLAKCPELAEYRIYEDTEHSPGCFDGKTSQ